MSAHACLKNELTEDEKYHNLLRWLINAYFRHTFILSAEMSFVIKAILNVCNGRTLNFKFFSNIHQSGDLRISIMLICDG